MRGRVRGIISAVTLAPGSSIDCAAWQRGWASPRRASWGPFHKGRPLATTSMRRSSATGTSRFMSASRTVRATLAPYSPDSHAMHKTEHSPGSDGSMNFSLTSFSFPQTMPCVCQGTVPEMCAQVDNRAFDRDKSGAVVARPANGFCPPYGLCTASKLGWLLALSPLRGGPFWSNSRVGRDPS